MMEENRPNSLFAVSWIRYVRG